MFKRSEREGFYLFFIRGCHTPEPTTLPELNMLRAQAGVPQALTHQWPEFACGAYPQTAGGKSARRPPPRV